MTPTTTDLFLGGRLAIEQPARGRHRAGLDAVLLAAAVPAGARGLLVDLGAGVGTAGLAAAVRAPGLDEVVLVERDEEAAALAEANRLMLGADAARIRVVRTDVVAPARLREAAGLPRAAAQVVLMNPPFFAPGAVRASPSAPRAAAHVLPEGGLDAWVRTAAATAAPGGRLILIFRGDALAEILAALDGRFGAAEILPVHPRAGAPAHRLIVSAIKGRRAAPAILPSLILHPAGSNAYLPRAEAILRGEEGLFEGEAAGVVSAEVGR